MGAKRESCCCDFLLCVSLIEHISVRRQTVPSSPLVRNEQNNSELKRSHQMSSSSSSRSFVPRDLVVGSTVHSGSAQNSLSVSLALESSHTLSSLCAVVPSKWPLGI